MPTDKTATIDLSALTAEGAGELVKVMKNIEADLEKSGKRATTSKERQNNEFQRSDKSTEKLLEKLRKQVELDMVNGKGKNSLKSKLFGGADFSKGGIGKNIVAFGLNPGGMIGGLLKTGIPGFAAAVAGTRIIVAILRKFDNLEKKFTNELNTKRKADRDNLEIARVQAGLSQEITSAGPGLTDPRDVYNSLDTSDEAEKRREEENTLRNTSAVE